MLIHKNAFAGFCQQFFERKILEDPETVHKYSHQNLFVIIL